MGARKRKATTRRKETRRQRSERNKREWAEARKAVPLGSVPGLPEIPSGPYDPTKNSGPTPEVVEAVLEQLAIGHFLNQLYSAGGYPSTSLWGLWVDRDDAAGGTLRARYARARVMQAASLAHLQFVYGVGLHRRSERQLNNAGAVARDKLRVDSARWAAMRLDPNMAERVQVDPPGRGEDLSRLSDEELMALRELRRKASGQDDA